MTSARPAQKFWLRPEIWVFLLIFLLRLVVLSRFSLSFYFLEQKGDMRFYAAWADRILAGHGTDGFAFYGLPGYAYLLACIFKLTGSDWLARAFVMGVLQTACEAATGIFIFRGVRSICKNHENCDFSQDCESFTWEQTTAGGLAALIWATFEPAQAFSVILMPTAWVVCVYWFLIWISARKGETAILWPWLPLGLLLGVTCMLVATVTFAAPLLMTRIALSVAQSRPWRERWPRLLAGMAVFVAGVFAGGSPAWIYNYFVARDPVLLSAHSGINFWMGNSPRANGYPKIPEGLRPGQEGLLADSILWAEKAAGHPLKRSEVSHYWSDQAQRYISTHPQEWRRLLAVKVRNFWNAFVYDDISVITLMRERGYLAPGLGWGFLAALGLAGMAFLWRSPPARWVTAAVLLHMMAIMPVFITERYRLAAAPGLIILSVSGLWWCWRRLVEAKWLGAAAYAGAALAAAWFVSLPATDPAHWIATGSTEDLGTMLTGRPNPAFWALDPFNVGVKELDVAETLPLHSGTLAEKQANQEAAAAELALAKVNLERAFRLAPENWGVLLAMGNLAADLQDRQKAIGFYEKALDLNPRDEGISNNLGYIVLESNPARAEALFRASLGLNPEPAKTHYLLARALAAQGKRAEASAEAQEAAKRNPEQREFRELAAKLGAEVAPAGK